MSGPRKMEEINDRTRRYAQLIGKGRRYIRLRRILILDKRAFPRVQLNYIITHVPVKHYPLSASLDGNILNTSNSKRLQFI